MVFDIRGEKNANGHLSMSQHAFIFSVCIQWLLRLVVTEMKTSHNMSENIARTSSKLGDAGYALPDTLESCQKALVQATRQLKASLQDKIETKNLCREHQNTLIQTYKTSGNSKLAENIRGLQQAKEMQQVFKKCRMPGAYVRKDDYHIC